MKIAIKVLTEWDRENVIPFFEKHYPNCNSAWRSDSVEIGYTFWVRKEDGKLFVDDKGYYAIPSDYTILQGVPKDMELPKVGLTFDEWFDGLSEEDAIALEKKYGYHGHDIGMTTTEWRYIYEQEFTINTELPNVDKEYSHLTNKDEQLSFLRSAYDSLNHDYKNLKSREQELEECLMKIYNQISYHQNHPEHGREGCTYGDTEYDSVSAHYGFNEAINNIDLTKSKELLNKK